jgi:formylglycine-generating enzyme required for sulfatase activity
LLENSGDTSDLKAFRTQYGKSNPFYDRQAEKRIQELEKQRIAIAPPPARPATAKSVRPAAANAPTRCDGAQIEITVGQNERRCLKPGAGKTEQFKDCPSCPDMVVVPSGSLTMGSPELEPQRSRDETQVQVSIAAPFAVGKFAVTYENWVACFADSVCKWPPDENWGRGKQPVINVSWGDAKVYTGWLSLKTGKSYRLLSEAEREYVTRAGTTAAYWWGSSIKPTQANYKGGGSSDSRTMPVDSFEANPWGLYNVHGNVWEWVEDCWVESHAGNPANGSARTDGNCATRVVRGGSWYSIPEYLRSASRYGRNVGESLNYLGFRVARTLNP